MYKKILTIFNLIIFIFSPTLLYAQRNIGKVEKASKKVNKNVLDIPVEQWMGKRFIFLEKPSSLQRFGYMLHLSKNFYSRCNPTELETEITCFLKYNKFVGKTIRVVDIEEKYFEHIVAFVEEKSNRKIYVKTHKGQVGEIALLDDIANAKERWFGKTIYSKKRKISTYSEDLDKYGEVKIKIGEPLKVIDILWGFDSIFPLWIIVETLNKEKGFLSTAFSWTNIYKDWWTEERPWEDDFFEIDPKQKYNWSNEIWELINSGKVRVGMNNEQIRLSWGKPEKINEDIYKGLIHEQWIYGSQYLYLENDKLTAIQSH